MEVNPVSIILVKSDSKGDRLLFRYPHDEHISDKSNKLNKRNNPYSIQVPEDVLHSLPLQTSNIVDGHLCGFSNEDLSTLFAVKAELCNQKFELKVNDVRFVAHPTLMQSKFDDQKSSSSILINIVFALFAHSSYSIVKSYYELSKRLGHALVYEESRGSYLSDEMKLMVKTHDEIATMNEEPRSCGSNNTGGGSTAGNGAYNTNYNVSGTNCYVNVGNGNHTSLPLTLSAFDLILERSTLAQCLKNVYHDLCSTGILNLTINQWITLSFCLPQKAHQAHKKGVIVEPEKIDHCLLLLKPYHGLLLLVDYTELLDCVPPSGARLLLQFINAYNPLKTLQNMASDSDLMIEHVYELVGHLVYWAKATIIYPLCETNVYVIAPDASLHTHSPLVKKFAMKFPGMCLLEVISDFSLPTSIGHLTTPLQHPTRQGTLAQMVLWMLQHHLLMQLHTYVQFIPTDNAFSNDTYILETDIVTPNGDDDSMMQDDDLHAGSLLSMSSQPMPVPNTSRRSLTGEHYSEIADSTTSDNIIVTQDSSSHKSIFYGTQSPSTENEESITSIEDDEKIKELLMVFSEPERSAFNNLPSSSNAEDLTLLVKLFQAGYFKGEHHLEEIMYFENLRRSQLLQLLDKFRDILIIYETEDPVISTFYTNVNHV